MKKLHQQLVIQMIKSAEGSGGLLHKITKPTAWRGGAQILKKEEEYCAAEKTHSELIPRARKIEFESCK